MSVTLNQADAPPCAFCLAMRRITAAILPILAVVSVIVAIWFIA